MNEHLCEEAVEEDVPFAIGVSAADDTEMAPISLMELTKAGLIRCDGGDPFPCDGTDEYELGLDTLYKAGIFGDFVLHELIPYHQAQAARIVDFSNCTREFFIHRALNIFYASNVVSAMYQLFMHPNFSCKSRLFQVRNGLLSIGDLCTIDNPNKDGPDLAASRTCIGATRKELDEWMERANYVGKKVSKRLGKKYKPIDWFDHPNQVEEVLAQLGFRHYDADAKADDFLVLLDETYPDNMPKYSDLLVMKKMAKPGDVGAGCDATNPHYFVVGCICTLGFGIVALPASGPTVGETSCPIQCIRFLTCNDDGGPTVAKTLFFVLGYRQTDPVMVPYFLCHGSVYERLCRTRSLTGAQPLKVTDVQHEFVRTNVYHMHDKFWEDPAWKFAPPQCVLAAKGFKAQLPLTGITMNDERLRGNVCVLNPRPEHMADVFNICKCKRRPGPPGTDQFLVPSATTGDHITFLVPKQTGGDGHVHVFCTGGYEETVGGLESSLDAAPSAAWLARLLPEIEAASRYINRVAPVAMPAEYIQSDDTEEVYYKHGLRRPVVISCTSACFFAQSPAKQPAVEEIVVFDKLAQELGAVALARQAQSEADQQAALALAQAEQEAAAKARLDKKERKKKEKEDYLSKNAPDRSAGTQAPEVVEENRIAREERLLSLEAADRRQKEADAKAEKEARRATKAAQLAKNPQLTKQQLVLLNQAAARDRKLLKKKAKVKRTTGV